MIAGGKILPTQTFYHLSKEKQEVILSAAKKEFSRASFNHSSINKIIEDAGISRGSFYMYFKDKKDILYYLLDEYISVVITDVKKRMEQSESDIFSAFIHFFDASVSFFSINEKNWNLFKNVFSVMHVEGEEKHRDFLHMHELMENKNRKKEWDEILTKNNKKHMKIKTEEDLHELFLLLHVLTKMAIMRAFYDIENRSKARERLLLNFEMLKYGILEIEKNVKIEREDIC